MCGLLLRFGCPRSNETAACTGSVGAFNAAASQLTWTGYAEAGSWAPSGTIQLQRGSFEYDGHTLRNGRFMRRFTTEETRPDYYFALLTDGIMLLVSGKLMRV